MEFEAYFGGRLLIVEPARFGNTQGPTGVEPDTAQSTGSSGVRQKMLDVRVGCFKVGIEEHSRRQRRNGLWLGVAETPGNVIHRQVRQGRLAQRLEAGFHLVNAVAA